MANEFTKVPNYFFEHMADMDKCEQSIVLLIIRKTLGFQKEWDRISFSQFQSVSGVSSPISIQRGIEAAIERGIIQRRQTKNSFEYKVCDPSENTLESEVILDDETDENTSLSEPKNTLESEVILDNTSQSESKSLHKVKTQKKKENKNNNSVAKSKSGTKQSGVRVGKTSENKSDDNESGEWFSAVCWLAYGHQDYSLLSKVDKINIGKTAKEIRASKNEYTIDDLRSWYKTKWSNEWPGKQPGKNEIQRPTLHQIKVGIGQVKAKAVSFNSKTEVNKSIAKVGELER